MAVDVKTRKPRLANTIGGLSGPAIRPVAVRLVHQVVQAVKLPVIGIGGIARAVDALEFLIVGATAVQVGTANFVDPNAMQTVIDGLEEFCQNEGIADINELIGSLRQ
jgi:dihydroorotate dehydrogenase (NAD+) catalytic subunit